MPSEQYQCGTCGSTDLVITAIGPPDRWRVECGSGHAGVPVPGWVLIVRTDPGADRDFE